MSSRFCVLLVWLSVLVLLGIGITMITSTGIWVEPENEQYSLLTKQIGFAFGGIVAGLGIAKIDYRILRKPWICWTAFAICLVLLAMCYLPMESIAPRLNGEKRWVRIAGLQFQPSEIAKLVVMICLSVWFAAWDVKRVAVRAPKIIFGKFFMDAWFRAIVPGLILGIPTGLILFERDMGTALAFGAAGACTMFIAGTKWSYLLIIAVFVSFLGMKMIQDSPNRAERIEAWQNLEEHKLDLGLQQWRAQLAMANGGVTGVGLGNGFEKHGYLPYAHTDFIFATIAEELGLAGSLAVIICLSGLTFGGIGIALNCQDPFGRILAFGITAMIFVPAMLNIYVVTALLPNSGLPLPFISAGGMNLLFSLIGIGLLTSIHMHTEPARIHYTPRAREKGLVEVSM